MGLVSRPTTPVVDKILCMKNGGLNIIDTVQSRFSDILFSDKSRFSDDFADDHFLFT